MVTLEYVSRVSSCGLAAMACAHPWGNGTVHSSDAAVQQSAHGFVECFAECFTESRGCISLIARQWIKDTDEFFGASVDVNECGDITIMSSHLPPPPAIGVTW